MWILAAAIVLVSVAHIHCRTLELNVRGDTNRLVVNSNVKEARKAFPQAQVEVKQNPQSTDCSNGQCRICFTDMTTRQRGCVTATAKEGLIHLALSVDGNVILEGDLKDNHPAPICSNFQMIEKICLVAKNVDLSKSHACVQMSMEIQGRTIDVPIGCFTIPQKTGTEPLILTNETARSLETDLIEDCYSGRCTGCTVFLGPTAAGPPATGCYKVTLDTHGFHIKITYKNYTIIETDTSFSSTRKCVQSMKEVNPESQLCVDIRTVVIKQRMICLSVRVVANFVFAYDTELGCMWVPKAELEPFRSGTNNLNILGPLASGKVGARNKPVTHDVIRYSSCKKGLCSLCKLYEGQTVCVIASAKQDAMHFFLELNGNSLICGDVTSTVPAPLCVYHVPSIPVVSELCMAPKNVNLQQMTACVDVSVNMSGSMLSVSFGCFTIPRDRTTRMLDLWAIFAGRNNE